MSVANISQDKTAQQLSIHQLSLSKVCRYFSIKEAEADFLDLIGKVVDLYNRAKNDTSYSLVLQQDGLPHFQLVVYAQVNKSFSRLARWIQDAGCEEDFTTKRVHYLFFFYRQIQLPDKKEKKEVFALTTGQAWRVVQRFSDYRFPPKIARRLFAPEMLSSKNRPLVGGVLTYSEILKQSVAVSDAEAVDKLFTRMKFQFRGDASIFNLPFFQNKKGQPLQRGMTVEIGLGLVRLCKDIHPENYPALLNHFATISRGEATVCCDGEEIEKAEVDSDEFDFLDYLHPVDFTLVRQLEKALVRIVYLTVMKDATLPALDFCHKNRSEYFHGTDHQVHYKGESLDCANPLSAAQMVDRLKKFEDLAEVEEESGFVAELDKVTVSFVFQGKREEAPFIQFLEGELRLPNGEVYWRLHNMWYEVRADYLGLIHQEFGKMLEKTLLSDKDPASMQHPWPSPEDKEKRKVALKKMHEKTCAVFKKAKKCPHKTRYDVEAEYNQTYLSEKNHLLGDKICPQGIELFDVLHFTQNHLYLYHVKEEFGQKTRDACSQIFNAAHLIHTLKHRASSSIVRQFYKEASEYSGKEKYRVQVKDKVKALGEDGFCKLFAKKVVFVYAFSDTSTRKEPRLLARDKGLKTRITPADLVKANAQFKKKGKKIFDALVKEQYLTSKGHLTSKFFAASADTFTLEMLKVDNQRKTLYRQLSQFSSQFNSTIAKLELLRLDRELEHLGFQLRVCQIRRTDYPKESTEASTEDATKDFAEVKDLPDLDEAELSSLREDLNEGNDFTYGAETFHIDETRGDGACGLHALLGTKKDGEYVYKAPKPNSAVRELFVRTLRARKGEFEDEYTKCLVDLLKDYLSKAPSRYVKVVFDPLKAQMAQLDERIEKLKAEELQLKQTQESQFESAIAESDDEESEVQEDLEKVLGASFKILRDDANRRNGAFRNNLNKVLTALGDSEDGVALSQTRDELDQLETDREALYEEFVQKPEVLEAYVAACQQRDYYFSTQEIGFAAHLFDKRVVIYGHRHLNQVYDPMKFGDEDNDEVVIFHKGRHFSHCQRNEAAESDSDSTE